MLFVSLSLCVQLLIFMLNWGLDSTILSVLAKVIHVHEWLKSKSEVIFIQ